MSNKERTNNVEQCIKFMRRQELTGDKRLEFIIDKQYDSVVLFRYCHKKGITSVEIPKFVTDVSNGLFKGIEDNLKVSYKGDGIASMRFLFLGYKGRELDLSNLDVSNVGNITGMFLGCDNLEKVNINGFKLEHLSKESKDGRIGVFSGCRNIKTIEMDSLDELSKTIIQEELEIIGRVEGL